MEEDKMFSISHWGMFEYEPKREVGVDWAAKGADRTVYSRPSKVASQFVGGWPYGRYAKIDEVIEKANKQIDLKA